MFHLLCTCSQFNAVYDYPVYIYYDQVDVDAEALLTDIKSALSTLDMEVKKPQVTIRRVEFNMPSNLKDVNFTEFTKVRSLLHLSPLDDMDHLAIIC